MTHTKAQQRADEQRKHYHLRIETARTFILSKKRQPDDRYTLAATAGTGALVCSCPSRVLCKHVLMLQPVADVLRACEGKTRSEVVAYRDEVVPPPSEESHDDTLRLWLGYAVSFALRFVALPDAAPEPSEQSEGPLAPGKRQSGTSPRPSDAALLQTGGLRSGKREFVGGILI